MIKESKVGERIRRYRENLDMSVYDLAVKMIKLSGLTLGKDIQIAFTGLRPGEKLYEEKLMAEEGLRTTDNAKIHIGCPIPFDTDAFFDGLEPLMEAAYANREAEIRGMIEGLVSTYHPAENALQPKQADAVAAGAENQ